MHESQANKNNKNNEIDIGTAHWHKMHKWRYKINEFHFFIYSIYLYYIVWLVNGYFYDHSMSLSNKIFIKRQNKRRKTLLNANRSPSLQRQIKMQSIEWRKSREGKCDASLTYTYVYNCQPLGNFINDAWFSLMNTLPF